MAKVTFNGTLLDDQEGNFSFTPGMFPRVGRGFEQLGRATALIKKDLATPGCQHMLVLRFYGVNEATIRTRLRSAYDNGQSTLTVAGYGSFFNCYLAEMPQLSEGSYSASVDGGNVGKRFQAVCVFVQTAR